MLHAPQNSTHLYPQQFLSGGFLLSLQAFTQLGANPVSYTHLTLPTTILV